MFWAPILITFGIHLGTFFQYFMRPRTLLFCSKTNAKPSILLLKPSHFEINFQSKSNVFGGLVFGPPFFIIFPRWWPKLWFWDSPWDPVRPKMAPKIDQVAPKGANILLTGPTFSAIVAHPCFHETKVITVPLEHGGFQMVICSMAVGSFSFFSEFLNAQFYIRFVSLFFIKH